MALLRRRNLALTVLLATTTVFAYAAIVFWARPGFIEQHYNAKQRLWAQFLASCDCQGSACAESFDLTMMHSSLYDKLMVASAGGNRSVVQHLVWQPHKLAAAYPWRVRMYAHMGLMLPRSLALMHKWWLMASEELAVALHHLAQGVPLVLDPDGPAGLRVEPDAVISCELELSSLDAPSAETRRALDGEAEDAEEGQGRDGGEETYGAEEQEEEAESEGEVEAQPVDDMRGGGGSGGRLGRQQQQQDQLQSPRQPQRRRRRRQPPPVGGRGREERERGSDGVTATTTAVEFADADAGGGNRSLGDAPLLRQEREGAKGSDAADASTATASSLQPPQLEASGAAALAPGVVSGTQEAAAGASASSVSQRSGGSGSRNNASGGSGGKARGSGGKKERDGGGGSKKDGGGRKGRGAAAAAEGQQPRFRCSLLEVRGAAPLLRLVSPPQQQVKPPAAVAGGAAAEPPPKPPQAGRLEGAAGGAAAEAPAQAAGGASELQAAVQSPQAMPAVPGTSGSEAAPDGAPGAVAAQATDEAGLHGGGYGGSGGGSGGVCSAGDGLSAEAGSCPAAQAPAGGEDDPGPAGGERSAAAGAANDAVRNAFANQSQKSSGGVGERSGGGFNKRRGRGGDGGGVAGGGGGVRGRGGRRQLAADGEARVCRNRIYIRPPYKSEVSEHVRESEASPLGLPPLVLLRLLLPRAAELAGWVLLPHVMLGRFVLLMAPPAPQLTTGPSSGHGGSGSGLGGLLLEGDEPLPLLHAGTQLMLMAGMLLTTFELLLWARVVSELVSLRRPRRSWARRRSAAWRVLYEGMVQPLREALLFWNVTHFVLLPLLQLVLPPPALDGAMLAPLSYCVVVLGAANSDVASRASTALLRVARRARHHEGGYQLQLLNILAAAEPGALPYTARLVLLVDTVGNTGRAAVAAALLEEAPGVAAALAAQQQQLQQRQQLQQEGQGALAAAGADAAGGGGAGAGDGGDGGGGAFNELAAAMRARVAPAADGRRRQGGGGEDDEYDSDEDLEVEDEGGSSRRGGRPVVLRWPAPLEFPHEVHDWEDVPRGFTCAITQQIMAQPAMLVSPELPAAPTYERAAIQQWLAGQMRDPKSNTPLRSYSLLPNEDLHRAIDDWVGWRLRSQAQGAEVAVRPPTPTKLRTRRRKNILDRLRFGSTADGDDAAAAMGRGQAVNDTAAATSRGPAPSGGAAPSLPHVQQQAAAASGRRRALDSDDDDGDGGKSASYDSGHRLSGSRSSSGRGRSCGGGGGGASQATSVLASLAMGASSLLEAGVEVMSRGAAAAAATATVAAATAIAATASRSGAAGARDEDGGAGGSGEPVRAKLAEEVGEHGGEVGDYGTAPLLSDDDYVG